MKHDTREEKGALVVAFSGDVDLDASPTARKVLLAAVDRRMPVLVDLSGIGYIDSSGIACLVEAYQKSRRNNTLFALVSVSDAALRVLQLARLDKVFILCPTIEDGFAKLS